MKILTSLKELFTFTPDKEGQEIGRVANVAVANFALEQLEIQRKRAEVCKCAGCKNQLKDAEDRVGWATEMVTATVHKKGKRHFVYSSGKHGDCDEYEG
jgi:hypothetical protein